MLLPRLVVAVSHIGKEGLSQKAILIWICHLRFDGEYYRWIPCLVVGSSTVKVNYTYTYLLTNTYRSFFDSNDWMVKLWLQLLGPHIISLIQYNISNIVGEYLY